VCVRERERERETERERERERQRDRETERQRENERENSAFRGQNQAGNQTVVFCKSSKYSLLLSHLPTCTIS
jgi:dihydrodipicolinate reductase